jgi:hypothetical protein
MAHHTGRWQAQPEGQKDTDIHTSFASTHDIVKQDIIGLTEAAAYFPGDIEDYHYIRVFVGLI